MAHRSPIALAVALSLAAPFNAARAQTALPHTITIRADNDAFNFWSMPWNRPDGEYTSGVHVTYDGPHAPWWSRGLFGGGRPCAVGTRACAAGSIELGQDIYTPSLRASDPVPSANARPSAGWLYLSQSARWLSEHRSDEITVTLGVTGEPSLARFTQRLAHSAAPEFNRPVDWTREIGFEPGTIIRYDQRRRVVALRFFDLVPSFAASVGNVATSAEAGLRSRVGWNLRHPWLAERASAEVAIVAGASGRLVARDLFLDGNTFQRSTRVGHLPFVASSEIGITLRHRAISLAYRTVVTSRAYAGGPRWHPWSSMSGGVTLQ